MVGFSKLIGEDEAGTLAALKAPVESKVTAIRHTGGRKHMTR
jgi:hypothetical protein